MKMLPHANAGGNLAVPRREWCRPRRALSPSGVVSSAITIMAISPGEGLGPYEIVESIGKGGMGEVFRARDTRLNRDVALKISPVHFTERFEREARAVAALNHPNICTLFDVATSPEGFGYLVMEYIEGVAHRGPLPLDEAVAIMRQISDALEDAHEKGITHRDLKPGNIKIKPDGTVKVLDFGLAKVTSAATGQSPSEDSPTLSMAATQAGVILGTAGYMSPEQASGLPADKRADIFAFGVVFYELLTGPRLFSGETLSHTLAAVLKDEPDWRPVPFQVQKLLKSCLEKDPKKRLRDIADVWKLWEERAGAVEGASAPSRSSWRPYILAALAFAGIAAASTLAVVHFRETPPVLQAVQFNVEPPDNLTFTNEFCGYAPSPDGHSVILSIRTANGSVSFWLRSLDSLKARPLPGTEGGNCPTWSPDSKSLIFTANGKIKRLDIAGGAPLTLADEDNPQVSATGTWNRDGVILFGGRRGLQRVSASGGGAVLLTHADPAKKESGHGYPQFLPDGNRFLYFVDSGDEQVRGVYASSLTNPAHRQLIMRTSAKAVYVSPRAGYPGYLLWLQEPTLLAQRFEQESLKLEGDPISVADEVGQNPGDACVRRTGRPMRGC